MADLVVGMAKSVVDGVLSKTQAAIEEEANLRQNAQRDLVFITGEFQMMQSFLNVTDNERLKNLVVRTLVKQIRDLAYDVEDCIEFVVHLDKKNRWWLRLVKPARCIMPCLAEIPLDEAVADIEQLKARVEDLSRRNARYSLISDAGSTLSPPEPVSRAAVGATSFNRITEVTKNRKGQQGDLTQLFTKEDGGLQVISIWGTEGGGQGMASIIWNAYIDKDACKTFTCRAWVKVRHPFNPREFLRSITAQFHASMPKEEEEEEAVIAVDVLKKMSARQGDLLAEFVRHVNENKYLVVLEDLSTMEEWNAIRTFFPNRKNGSCIIVSTQQFEVASLSVGHPYQVLHLNQLSAEHSVYAFYKTGFECDGVQGAKTIGRVSLGMDAISKKNTAEEWMKVNPLAGRESQMKDLYDHTKEALWWSYQVMSVWGIAGVGKSYLVRKLFCERILMKRSIHQKYGWVDVSHPFNLSDLSRSLFLSFHSESLHACEPSYYDNMGSKNPIVQCREILKQYKCLVVLDGLKCTKEWDLIQAELVSGSHAKTLFIIITNEQKITKHCRDDKGEFVFNVKGLEPEAAFHLFEQISMKNALLSSLSHGEIAEVRELTSKCGGLPKVIVEIASSLASKTVGWMEHARSINKKFMQELETNRELNKLDGLFDWMNAYFRNCPDFLKPCIFYLSIFPQDHIIRRRRLIRRWIAEGYSRNNHDKSAEENGEKHFSDLQDLSIIQQPTSLALGNTRTVLCQVNGFFREYIISQRMEENLVFELDGSCVLTTQRTGRHLVISKSWRRDRIVFESIDFSRLRSLTVFGMWKSFFISENMKLLRVLDLEDVSGVKYEDLKKIVKHLRRLKFLSLRRCQDICHLPSALGHLRQLQSLDVRGTSILNLRKNVTKLQKLQYIRAGMTNLAEDHHVGVQVPLGIGKLTALHTLGVVNISVSGTAVLEELKKLTQLHKLGVSGINMSNCNKFFCAISDLALMESLSLRLDRDSQRCLEDQTLPLDSLRSLKLYGLGGKLPGWSNQLSRLAKLDLEMAALMKHDIVFLGKLQELCILRLRVKHLQDGELNFCVITNGIEDDSYKKIKILDIGCSLSVPVTFGSKTMKTLELLKVDCSSTSPLQFSGLENLSELKEVLIKCPSDESLKEHLQSLLSKHENKPVVNQDRCS